MCADKALWWLLESRVTSLSLALSLSVEGRMLTRCMRKGEKMVALPKKKENLELHFNTLHNNYLLDSSSTSETISDIMATLTGCIDGGKELLLFKKKRAAIRDSFTKIVKTTTDLFSVDGEKDLVVIETNHQLLKGKYTELANLDEQILNSLLESDASENELSSEIASADEYKANWSTMCIHMGRFKVVHDTDVESTASIQTDYRSRHYSKNIPTSTLWDLGVLGIEDPEKKQSKTRGDLSAIEVDEAEVLVIRFIQKESFQDSKSETVKSLNLFVDAKDVLRLKTRISEWEDGWAGSPRHELARGGGPEMGCTLWANEINRRRVKALADQWGQ
uniref:Uncharacterized protein n=1 Tax=Timema shepardi TaxID=629360 RepID=A0A7R9B0H4_TIMSH|nr:unnamed protein product [Timema shepardi]